jgi:hypothetical protein
METITERLQAAGFTAEQIEKIIALLEEAKAIAQRNDENDTWVSSEDLRQMLIDRYGEQYFETQ